MPGRPAAARRDHPGGPQDPSHRRPADREALHRGELLAEVVVIEPRVPPLREGHDLGSEGVGEPLGRPAPAIPMREALRPVPLERPPEPAHLSGGKPQPFGSLSGRDPAPLEQAEYVQAATFLWGQCHLASPSCVRERTESLNR